MVDRQIGYHGNPALPTTNMLLGLTQFEMDEYYKCMTDPYYFIENYVQINRLGQGLGLFKLRPYQKEMIKLFEDNKFSILKVFRQAGKTITVAAYILWKILFTERYTVGIAADKKLLAVEILDRIKLSYEHIPNFLKQAIISWNKGNIEFDNGSKVKTFAASPRGVSGFSIDLLYIDEFAHIQADEAFYTGAYPVVTSSDNPKIIITSTPKGFNNQFFDIWDKAERNMSEYVPFQVHWSALPGRDQKWKEDTISNTSEEQFRQEFEVEFLGSSNTLISGSKLEALIRGVKRTLIHENNLDLYEVPQQNHTYSILVDVAEGQNKDYSAFSIIDVTALPYKQIGKYRDNKIAPLLFPSVIYNVARRFNDAYVLVEINSIGLQIASFLHDELEYMNLLKINTKSPLGVGQHISPNMKGMHLGVKTTSSTKRIGCANLKTLVESDKLLIWDDDTVKELKSFVAHKESFAGEGKHDDLAMTLVLFGWLSTQSYFKELIDSNVRNTLQDETINLYKEKFIGVFDKGPASDPYSLNWKDQYDWDAFKNDPDVQQDDDGDVWVIAR